VHLLVPESHVVDNEVARTSGCGLRRLWLGPLFRVSFLGVGVSGSGLGFYLLVAQGHVVDNEVVRALRVLLVHLPHRGTSLISPGPPLE